MCQSHSPLSSPPTVFSPPPTAGRGSQAQACDAATSPTAPVIPLTVAVHVRAEVEAATCAPRCGWREAVAGQGADNG